MLIMITNTIVPYCYDVAHVLGLPSSFSHRFRYRRRWVKIPYRMEDTKGREGIIVLRHFEKGDFIPVRYVKIEDVLSIGDIHYVEFQLKDYFPITMRQKASDRIKEYLLHNGFENKGDNELECLVFELKEDLTEGNESKETAQEQEKWSEILNQIGRLDCYKDFSFLKILHIRTSGGGQVSAKQDETGKYSFTLDPGRLYYLDVIQQVPWEIDKTESIETPYDVELKAETDEVIILRKIQRVVGKYDLLRFIFKTAPGHAVRHTFLEVESKQSEKAAKYLLPALFLPIRVQPPWWMVGILRGQILLSILAIMSVIGSDPLSRALAIGPDWIRAFGLLILVLASRKWDEVALAFVKEAKEVKIK